MSEATVFKLKHFILKQRNDVFKIGTDAMILGSWISLNPAPKRILDLGTGTGILSLMLAQKYPQAQIVALDSNQEAVSLAKENFASNELGRHCSTIHNTFSDFTSNELFDLIVSNPPYFLNSKVSSSEVNSMAKHLETADLRVFFACVSRNLNHNGVAALVHPSDGSFESIATEFGFFVARKLSIYGVAEKLVRVCNIYSKQACETVYESLIVRENCGTYTKNYKALTLEFHGVEL
jgi:tRNA1Val (adenine37-N6)-methyltransferase